MSKKSLRNQANHGFLAWAEDPRGRKGALPLERMRKRWRAGDSGVYPFVAGQSKWKSRLRSSPPSYGLPLSAAFTVFSMGYKSS